MPSTAIVGTYHAGGFYAELQQFLRPAWRSRALGVSLDSAGALAASGLTALQGIDGVLRVRSGERLIIHGASGAVGTLAIQLAKLRGALVLATASGDDGIALARHLGADAAVDGRHGDIVAAAHRFAPLGADALLALAAGEGLERCIDGLRSGGRARLSARYRVRAEAAARGSPLWLTTPYRDSRRKLSLRV